MKILIMVCSFPPEISAGHLEYELARALLSIGHKVAVVTAFPRRYLVKHVQKQKGMLLYRERISGMEVTRVGPEFSKRDNLFVRGAEYFADFVLFLLGGLVSRRSDVILCSSPPMTVGLAGCVLARIRKVQMILRIGDIHPQALIDLKLLKNRFLIWILKVMEKLIYQKADRIVVLSERYRRDVITKGANPSKVGVISNWVDTDEIAQLGKSKEFRRKIGLADDFLVTYAGIMSWPQDLETVIDSASLLDEYIDIMFLLVGDGPQRGLLDEKSEKLGIKNLKFLPLQPRKAYLEIIRASDVCLVSLKKDFRTPSVPSKLLDIMACGRPVLANVPLDGDVSKIIRAARCGLCVEPQNPEKLSKAILDLYSNPSSMRVMGINAKKFFKDHFSLKLCVRSYEKIFAEVASESGRS